jgi:hypothetical protein
MAQQLIDTRLPRTLVAGRNRQSVVMALPPEIDQGNVEYKLKLIQPSPERFQHLVTVRPFAGIQSILSQYRATIKQIAKLKKSISSRCFRLYNIYVLFESCEHWTFMPVFLACYLIHM